MKPIERLRQLKGLSLRAVEEKTGITNAYISGLELSRYYQTIDNTVKLSKGLDTSIDYIIGKTNKITPLTKEDKIFIERYEEIEKQLKELNKTVKPRTK